MSIKKYIILFILVFSSIHAYADSMVAPSGDFAIAAADTPYSDYLMPDLMHTYATAYEVKANIYGRPYSVWDNEVDSVQLKRNTMVLFGAGIGAMGLLYLMPSSFTNWEDSDESPFEKWWNNVSDGPVWDRDDYFLNYVTHPYSGAIYYMGARSAGANVGYSFLYSFLLSAFFWEYGIEAFAEVPSIQDLIITPVAGAILGEGFYLIKRYILDNDYYLLNSRILGHIVAIIIDPITEIFGFFTGGGRSANVAMTAHPAMTAGGNVGYQFSLRIEF